MLQKLTKAFVDKIGLEQSSQVSYRNSELIGLGLRVGKSKKVFFAESKLDGKTIRKSIARHNVISVEDARAQAKKILAEIANGKTPFDEIKARRSNIVTVK
jgi:hypothetical protein